MIDITNGRVLINGFDLKYFNSIRLRKSFSVIPQDIVLLSGSVRENIDPEAKYSDDQIRMKMKLTKLDHVFKDLEEIIVQNGSKLSSGQKQLICFTRALLQDNSILIIDEATSGLDLESEMIVNDLIVSSCKTIISITHKVSSLLKFDQILVIEDGQIIEKGTPKELMANDLSLFQQLLQAEYNQSIS
jgi:PREDICTED: ATP-binding cassette transporter sub-family C member 9-like